MSIPKLSNYANWFITLLSWALTDVRNSYTGRLNNSNSNSIGRTSSYFLGLAFDTAVFVLTVSRTLIGAMHLRKSGHSNSISGLLFRDGQCYGISFLVKSWRYSDSKKRSNDVSMFRDWSISLSILNGIWCS